MELIDFIWLKSICHVIIIRPLKGAAIETIRLNVPNLAPVLMLVLYILKMKKRQVIFLFISCFLFTACVKQYTNNTVILKAESLLMEQPDSAYRILKRIPHPEQLSTSDYAAWCLLYTHSQFKLYQDIKSDSIIRIAVRYYDNSSLYKQSGTSYYLLGCILQMNKKNKEAMLAYKKADDVLKNTDESDLIGLVKFKIGYLYKMDETYSQSFMFFKQSLNCFIRSKNIKYQSYAYREMSEHYFRLNYPIKDILYYSNRALKLSYQSGDSLNYYSILGYQGNVLINSNYARSKEYLLKASRYFPTQRASYAVLLARDYAKLHKLDSAKYYLQISLSDTLELNYRSGRYFAFSEVARNEGDYKQAFAHLIRAYNVRDSTFQQTLKSQLYRIDKQYDIGKKETEIAALKISNQQKVILIALLTIAVLMILIFMLGRAVRHKKKQAEYAMEKQRMEFELKAKSTKNEQKRQLLLTKLQSRVENTLRFNLLKNELVKQNKQEVFMAEITKQAVITEKEWAYYIDEVNQLYEGEINNLEEQHADLTRSDIIVIALIFLKVDVSDCCNLLNMTKNTMYKRRTTIKKRIGIDMDIDLEEWLQKMIMGKGD
jgi:hypothetical protein